jgi:two-component system sensor histidine kinase ChvG
MIAGNMKSGRRGVLSRLTLRILAINLFAVAILFVGVLYLDRYQNSLINAELGAINRQGRVFAQALAEMTINKQLQDQQRLSELAVRRLVRRLAPTVGTRVRIFAPDGRLLADSALLRGPGGAVRVRPLQAPIDKSDIERLAIEFFARLTNWLPRRADIPRYLERADQIASDYQEVRRALAGEGGNRVRLTETGELLLSVAVPVQSYKAVLGALMLSIEGREIDRAVRAVRVEILGVFAIVFAITVLLSLYLAGSIIRPVQRLARAAEVVRAGRQLDAEIPDLGGRGDEIGDLSIALRGMTHALGERIDAIERFAADVAHEIKNPLTSLRSAVETVTRVEDGEQRRKLMAIILDDVQRLDRLISDISDASRVDAEMGREDFQTVDLAAMVATLSEVYEATQTEGGPRLVCDIAGDGSALVAGNENRLVQVLRNLINNAISFSPTNGVITLTVQGDSEAVDITIDDHGPGIPAAKLASIFERFYSERPSAEKFGTHSGLGLSISAQIIAAHGGRIWAENRLDPGGQIRGARFVIRLPRDHPGKA